MLPKLPNKASTNLGAIHCEGAGLGYAVRTVPLRDRGPAHFARQPFGQVPFLSDAEIDLFESGACLLHLARKSETLMPTDPAGET